MNKTIAVIAAAAAVITFGTANAAPLPEAKPDDVGFSSQGLARLDNFFAREIAAKRVPGAVVAGATPGNHGPKNAERIRDPDTGTPNAGGPSRCSKKKEEGAAKRRRPSICDCSAAVYKAGFRK